MSRSIESRRNKNSHIIKKSREFGYEYFDGEREFGYGGYFYDGRYLESAKEIVAYYSLPPNSRILDVGCAKGFLVKEFLSLGMDCHGLDISKYAIDNCHPDVVGRVRTGNAIELPFADNTFDFVISVNTLHNLEREEIGMSLKEIGRVSKNHSFVQVDSYLTPAEKISFEKWVLTAKFHDYPREWLRLFKEFGYNGDWDWTIFREG